MMALVAAGTLNCADARAHTARSKYDEAEVAAPSPPRAMSRTCSAAYLMTAVNGAFSGTVSLVGPGSEH